MWVYESRWGDIQKSVDTKMSPQNNGVVRLPLCVVRADMVFARFASCPHKIWCI